MDSADFTQLLEAFPATVVWSQNFPCDCILFNGQADRACQICGGTGTYYAPPSEPFEVALISQTAKERAAIAQTMGPGMMGDSVMVIFEGASCYCQIGANDQIWDCVREETHRINLLPGVLLRLPPLHKSLTAMVKSQDGKSLVSVPPPIAVCGRISVSVPTRIDFVAGRGYEVIAEFTKIRTFGEGLPKRLALRLLDITVR